MRISSFLFTLIASAFMLGCGAPASNVNTNANSAIANTSNPNININSNINSNISANLSDSSAAVDTKEPDQYQATVTLKFETIGDQKITVPALQANVARSGDDRRMEFALPNGEKLIYLDKGGRQLLVSPNRKQYAELNKEALGFEVRRLMMPSQIVNQVKNMRGVERVGEEQVGGRTVVKYRYGATANTGTQAGQVNTESFILVDKETGLPLRSETISQSQSGNVQGVTGIRAGTEMTNISTAVDPALFADPPADYRKVQPEEVRQQVDLIFRAARAILPQLLQNAQAPAPAATVTVTVTPTVSPTAQ